MAKGVALPAAIRAQFRPAAAQWLATCYVALASLGLSVLLARRMGPEAFGTYFYILGIVTLLAPFQNAGFSTLLLREKISATPALATLAPALPGLALGHLLAVSLAMMCGTVLLLPFPDAARLSCGIFCFGAITLSQQVSARLKSAGDFYGEARWQTRGRTFSALPIVAAALLTIPSPNAVFLCWGGGLLMAFRLLPCGDGKLRPHYHLETSVYQASLGFLWIELATTIYHRIDIVILHHLLGDAPAIGHYAVAYRLFDGVVLLIAPIASICFRELRLIWQDTNALRQLSGKLLLAALGIGTLLAASGYFAAPVAVRLFFGASYAGASAELAGWLFLGLAFIVPNAILTQLAIATNRERCYAWAACFSALLNISLNFALIPAHGIIGAAWATVMTEAGLGLALYIGILRRKNFSGPPA
jgi:O-antigen/teichoic acid export membrane protein